MNEKGKIDSIFDFFDLIIDYYRDEKSKDNRFNLKIPSQLEIGSLFGGLGTNYSMYKKNKKLPNIWGKTASESHINEDIFNKLYASGIIPQDKSFRISFMNYINAMIVYHYKNRNHKFEIINLLNDLDYYKKEGLYKEFVKSVIEFSNKKYNMIYHSKLENKLINLDEDTYDEQNLIENKKYLSIMNMFFSNKLIENNLSNEKSSYYSSQKYIIKNNLKAYVKRTKLDTRFETFLRINKSGVFWVEGIPGQGKSCWISWIIEQYSAVHHFIDYSERKNSISNMIRSLMSQLKDKYNNNFGEISDNENQLYNQFSNMIFDISLNLENKLLICIDAIDELENINNINKLDFVPDNLPDNIYFVFTSRHLIKFNYPQNTMIDHLEPFTIDDIQEHIKKLNYDIMLDNLQDIYKVSNGNPMVMKWCFELYKKNKFSIKNTFTNLESVLDQTFNKIYSEDNEKDIIRLLSILVISKIGLTIPLISKLMNLKKIVVVKIIKKQLRGILKSENNKISIMHRVVLDYLVDDANDYSLDTIDLKYAQELMTLENFDIENESEESYEYFINFSLYHYFYLGRYNDIVSKLILNKNLDSQVLLLFISEVQIQRSKKYLQLFKEICKTNSNNHFDILIKKLLEVLIEFGYLEEIDLIKDSTNIEENLLQYVILKRERVLGNVYNVLSIGKNLITNNIDDLLKRQVYFILGEGYRERGKHSKSLDMYKKALDNQNIQKDFIIYTNINLKIADITYVYGDLIESEKILIELNKFINNNKLLSLKGNVYRGLGQIENVKGNYKKAADIYNKALESDIKLNQPLRLAEINNSLAEVILYLDNEKASEYIELGRKYSIVCNGNLELGKTYYLESNNLFMIGNLGKAEIAALKALEILNAVGYGSGVARSKLILAEVKHAMKDYEESLKLSIEVLKYYVKENIYPSHRYNSLKLALANEKILKVNLVDKIDNFNKIPYKENFPLIVPIN